MNYFRYQYNYISVICLYRAEIFCYKGKDITIFQNFLMKYFNNKKKDGKKCVY